VLSINTVIQRSHRTRAISGRRRYSAHPLACAAALATLDVHQMLDLSARVQAMAPVWQEALHGLRDAPHVADLCNIGLLGAIDLARIFHQ